MENNKLLFIVEETFLITGLGLVLTPGPGDKVKLAKVGTKIKLVRPDKTELETVIIGIMFESQHDIAISSKLSRKDVPYGTEVWLAD